MAIVNKSIKYEFSGRTKWVDVNYDDEIIEVKAEKNLTVINFINGYGIYDNANIIFRRWVGDNYRSIETLTTDRGVTGLVPDSSGNSVYIGFKFNLSAGSLNSYTIDLSGSNLYNPNAEPEPVDPEPVDPEPVDPEPVDPEPVEPEPEPEPEPEIVDIKIPSLAGTNNYKDLMESGFITVRFNGQDISYGDSIPVTKYGEFTIEIINNQLNQQFDYDNIDFYHMEGNTRIEYDPYEKTADKIVFKVNADNWVDTVGKFVFSPNIFVYLNFKYRENEITDDYPFLNIYKVDDDSLKTLSNEVNVRRFKKDYDIEGNIIKDYDVSGSILDLVRIPYAIETEPDLIPINLNSETMESQGYEISNYIQEINLGKINCNHETLKDVGYKNIEFNLFVPNFKPISLEVPKVIERTVEMKLYLDLTTGFGTLNLLIEGVSFHVEQNKITKDIPFKSDSVNVSLNDEVLNTKYLNPYLEISVLNPDNAINSHELTQRNIQKSSVLYAQADKILLTSHATYNEQLEIEMLLRKGVYVNG